MQHIIYCQNESYGALCWDLCFLSLIALVAVLGEPVWKGELIRQHEDYVIMGWGALESFHKSSGVICTSRFVL